MLTLPVLTSIAMYTILSGAGPAAIRAGMMGALLVIAPRIGRSYDIYSALAFAALLMSLEDPFILWEAGFLLSFLGTLGIVLFTPYLQRLLHPLTRFPGGHTLAETVAMTMAAQIATLPIFATTFQNISLIAPLANMLTVPLLGILITLGTGLCLGGLVFLPLATLWGWLIWPLLWYVEHIVDWCAHVPGAYIPVNNFATSLTWGYYGLLALSFWWLAHDRASVAQAAARANQHQHAHPIISPRLMPSIQASVAVVVLLGTGIAMYSTPGTSALTVTFLAVGPANQPLQGEAILIRTPDKRTILIDGGLDSVSLGQELDSRLPPWQHTLDLVVLTTPLREHLSGLLDVENRYQITMVIDAGMLHSSATYAQWRRNISERYQHYLPVVQGRCYGPQRHCIRAAMRTVIMAWLFA